MNSSKRIKKGQIEDYISDSTQVTLDNKVEKVLNQSLISDAEKIRLSTIVNFDNTSNITALNNKVDKVTGKSLILDTEITRLANVSNTDISGKVDKNANIIAGTGTKISYDAKGLVISAVNITPSDVPTLNQNTTGTSSTITGSIVQAQVTNLTADLAGKQPTGSYATGTGTANGTNTGDETLLTLQTKRPLKTIEGQTIEGAGNIDLTKTDVGLSNVDNTSDLLKPISTTAQTALDLKVDKVTGKSLLLDTEITRLSTLANYTHPANHPPSIITQDVSNRFVTDAEKATWNAKQSALGYTAENVASKNIASGYAGLGVDGKLISSQLPSITISDTFVTASQAAMLAVIAETGDVAVRTDLSKSFILKGTNPTILADWQELLTPTSAVTTVFGRNGGVVAQAGDYTADQITETATRVFQTPTQRTNNDATSSIQTQLNGKASGTGSATGTNTGDNATNTQYSGLVSNATHTGDATGSTALTLATVNANVGTFGNASNVAQSTVNAKGLTTAIANVPIQIVQSQVTGLVADLAGKETAFSKNTAFNKNFGTIVGTVVEGGTLGSNAYNSTAYLPLIGGTVSGDLAFSGTGRGISFNGLPTQLYETAGSLRLYTNSSDRLTVLPNGNVGIGTTAPTKTFHVKSASNEAAFFEGTLGGTWIDIKSSVSNLWSIGARDANSMGIFNRTTGLDVLSIANGGAATFTSSVTATSIVSSIHTFKVGGSEASKLRWSLEIGGNESGSNNGSDYGLYTFSDTGAYLGQALNIKRNTGAAAFSSSVTAPTFIGALNGNASTANLAANSTNWAGYGANFGVIQTGSPDYIIAFQGGVAKPFESAGIKSFLGLGSNAYNSTGFLPLTGGTLTGALNGTMFNISTSDARFTGGNSAGRLLFSNSSTTSYAEFNGNTGPFPDDVAIVSSVGKIKFFTNAVQRLIIQNTGQAEFSSSVTAIGATLTGALNINLGTSSTSVLNVTSGGVQTRMGSLNSSYFHVDTDASAGLYFYDNITTAGQFIGSGTGLNGYAASLSIGGASRRIEFNDGPRTLTDRLPNTFPRSVNFDFVNASVIGGTGNYSGVMTFTPWEGTTISTGDSSYQLAFHNESGVNGSGIPGLKLRKGIDSTWGAWSNLITSSNFNTYALPLTGGTLTSGTIEITGAASKYLYINPGNGYEAMVRYNGGSGSGWYVGKRTATTVQADTASFHFFSEANGDTVVGIDPTGNIRAKGDVIAYSSSDKRFKNNITKISNPIDKINKIGGYTFNWNKKQTVYKGHDVGVIAQEIENILPELVTTRDDGYKAVKYDKLVALLIEGIKEQQRQIDGLQEQINKLK